MRCVLLAWFVAAAGVTAWGQAAPTQAATTHAATTHGKKTAVLRSGSVLTCQMGQGCRQEVVNGQRVFTMEANGLVVRATLGQEQRVSFADLKIENKTGAALMVLPEDFRIEVDEARFKRLSYVDPAGSRHARLERVEEMDGHGLPPPDYWTSVEHREAKEARLAAQSGTVKLLARGAVEAGGTVAGRVYFERPKGATERSLILPFRDTILEFPFPRLESTRKGKAAPARAEAAQD